MTKHFEQVPDIDIEHACLWQAKEEI